MSGTEITIRIADFSRAPFFRYSADGVASGEAFRDDILIPALRANDRVIVDIDGVSGYAACFLDEVFGELRRGNPDLAEKLAIQSKDPRYSAYKLLTLGYLSGTGGNARKSVSSSGPRPC